MYAKRDNVADRDYDDAGYCPAMMAIFRHDPLTVCVKYIYHKEADDEYTAMITHLFYSGKPAWHNWQPGSAFLLRLPLNGGSGKLLHILHHIEYDRSTCNGNQADRAPPDRAMGMTYGIFNTKSQWRQQHNQTIFGVSLK